MGPAFLGYRDERRDAFLYHWHVREQGAVSVDEGLGEGEEFPIRLGGEAAQVPRWRSVKSFVRLYASMKPAGPF
jgi:hypothetical protein